MTLAYIEQLLTLASAVFGSVSISDFTSLVGIPITITTSAAIIKTCAITAEIKKYKSIIKKKKRNMINTIVSKN